MANGNVYYIPYEITLYEFSSPKTVEDYVRGFSWRKSFVYKPKIVLKENKMGVYYVDDLTLTIEKPYWLHTFRPAIVQVQSNVITTPKELNNTLSNLSRMRYTSDGKIMQRLVVGEVGISVEYFTDDAGIHKLYCQKDVVIPPDFFKLPEIPTEIDPVLWVKNY